MPFPGLYLPILQASKLESHCALAAVDVFSTLYREASAFPSSCSLTKSFRKPSNQSASQLTATLWGGHWSIPRFRRTLSIARTLVVRERASDGVDNGIKCPPIVDVNSDVDHAIATYDLHTIHSIINETPVLHVRIFCGHVSSFESDVEP